MAWTSRTGNDALPGFFSCFIPFLVDEFYSAVASMAEAPAPTVPEEKPEPEPEEEAGEEMEWGGQASW